MRNTNIREKRKINFNYKVVNLNLIRSIAAVIEKQVEHLPKDELKNSIIIYSVDATDNSSYESQNPDIFGTLIEQKVIHKVTMRFSTPNLSKNIEVQFVHTYEAKNNDSFLLISGDDNNWVNGVLAQFMDCMNLAKKQYLFPDVTTWLVVILFWIFSYVSYQRVYYRFLMEKNSDMLEVVEFFLFIGILGAGLYLGRILANTWPPVELQTGPQHLHHDFNRRKKLWSLFSFFVLPLILTWIGTFLF